MIFLKTLQNKSESMKRTMMWFSVIFIMVAIFIFWVLNFPASMPVQESNETSDANISLSKIPGVWQSLKDQMGNLEKISPTLRGFIPKFKDNQ